MGEETEDAKAVVDGDENYAPRGPRITVHRYLMAVAVEIGSAMYPESHGKLPRRIANGIRRCPDVQIQAVLALNGLLLPIELIAVERPDGIARLPADITEFVSYLDALPLHDGLRTFPTEVTHRWRSVRNASENSHPTCCGRNALYHSSLYFHHGTLCPGQSCHQAYCQ